MSITERLVTGCVSAALLALLAGACTSHTPAPPSATATSGTTPEDQLLQQFWHDIDLADTARLHDKHFIEQTFVDLLAFLPYLSDAALATAFTPLLAAGAADSIAMAAVTDSAEKYLGAADSPYRNEEYYILFLETLMASPPADSTLLVRPRAQLAEAQKNRPGTIATNFRCTTRTGQHTTLHSLAADYLLLIFYDPACTHCTDILADLATSETINTMISTGMLTVLAVYTEGDSTLWRQTNSELPPQWTVAIDTSHIVDHALYALPAMPLLYLLAADKTVLLKDPTPAEAEDRLFQVLSSTLME